MIEAPKNKSGNQWSTFSISSSANDGQLAKLFKKEKTGRTWHPDTISEVESDSTLRRYTGEDLRDAQAEFTKLALQSPPPPGMKNSRKWIPSLYVENEKRKNVFAYDWAEFTKLWRKEDVR